MDIDIFALIRALESGKTVLTLAQVIDIARECEFLSFEQETQKRLKRENSGNEL